MVNETSISRDSESYRRGVVFGLTMAEVLLLLIFCILLFLKLVSDRLDEKKEELAQEKLRNADLIVKNEELNSNLQMAKEQAEELEKRSRILAAKAAQIPDTVENTRLVQELVEAAVVLEEVDPNKASELLFNLKENPDYLSQVQMTEIDEFSELTTKAQYSVSPQEYAVLSNLNPQEKENLLGNAEAVSKLSVDEFEEMQTKAELFEQPLEPEKEEGNNWPPIISLSEAQNYSFRVGNATLAPQFTSALQGSIAKEILSILQEYDADVIEVIGHTDPQPMRSNRTSNLDKNANDFLNSSKSVNLSARDNAGLGYARALSVTKELMKVPELAQYTILPYSGAQMITPNEELSDGVSGFNDEQLRRIEIRVRRKQGN
ncbi:MAG: hypothetical protein ACJ0DF_13650 [Paracoccaceae bacterium]